MRRFRRFRFALVVPLLLSIALPGCVIPTRSSGPFGPDPFQEALSSTNDAFSGSTPVFKYVPRFFTALGNVIGAIAFMPLTIITGPIDWLILGDGDSDEAPLVTGTVAVGAYLVGFLLGSPFVMVDAGLSTLGTDKTPGEATKKPECEDPASAATPKP